MLAMLQEPEEPRCGVAECKAVGITERARAAGRPPILLCSGCARVWDKARGDLMSSIRAANKGGER